MEPSPKLDELNRRVTDVESTLRGLKLAATVLGVSGALILSALLYVAGQTAKAKEAASDAAELADDVTGDLEARKEAAIEMLQTAANERQEEISRAFADGVTSGTFKIEPDQQNCVDGAYRNCPDGFDLKCPDGMVMVYLRNYGGGNTCIQDWRCCALAIRKLG